MKGIYLTEEGKLEIEAKIGKLEQRKKVLDIDNFDGFNNISAAISVYKEILSDAIILPVEESWKIVAVQTMMSPATESYPQGVIIQPKQ